MAESEGGMTQDQALAETRALTHRQLQVLTLAAKGLTSAEVGAVLSISQHTANDIRKAGLFKLRMTLQEACWLLGRAGLG